MSRNHHRERRVPDEFISDRDSQEDFYELRAEENVEFELFRVDELLR